MQSSHISKCLVILWVAAGGLGVWAPGIARADFTNLINGPYRPSSDVSSPVDPLPGDVTWESPPHEDGAIGRAGGVGWQFSNIPLASSNHLAVWFGGMSNGVRLSFSNNAYMQPGEVLSYTATNSDLANGRVVWRGQTPMGPRPVHTKFTLTLGASPSPTDWGQALSFDGVDDFLVVSNFGSAVPTNEVTVEFWQRLAITNEGQTVFSLDPEQGTNRFMLDWRSDASVIWDFGNILQEPRGRLWSAPSLAATNTWQHFAVVARAGTGTDGYLAIYRDGVLAVETNTTIAFVPGAYDLWLGNRAGGGAYHLKGELDDFRIWSVVRTPEEIQADMGHPLTGTEPGLLTYWNFDEGSGTSVHDSTTNGYEAALVNGPAWTQSTISGWGNALSFDGTSTVRIPNFGWAMPTNEVTVEVWLRIVTNQYTWPVIFSLEPDQITNRFNAHVGARYPSGNLFWDFGDIQGGSRVNYNSPAPVGVWQHFAFVASQSGNYMKVFRNGVQEYSIARFNDFARGNYDLVLGPGFVGELDEFRIWSVARTPEQIQGNMRHILTGSEPNLVAYFRFDEPRGVTTVHDATANHFEGTLVDGVAWADTPVPLPMVTSFPLELIEAHELGLATNAGAVVRIPADTVLSANLLFEASTNGANGPFYPAYDVYDGWYVDPTHGPAGSANSWFRGAFYYGYKPFITAQPVPVGAMAGSNVSFTVAAGGLEPLRYRWVRDGTDDWTDGTNATLLLSNVQYNAANTVVVANHAGSVTSVVATLMVTNMPGYEIKPPPEANMEVYKDPLVSPGLDPPDGANWNSLYRRLTARNIDGLLTVTWKDANTNDLVRTVWIEHVDAVSYELGQEIPPPNPTIEPTNGVTIEGGNTSAVFWHRRANKLYAAGPGAVNITWYTTNNAPVTVPVENAWPTNDSRYQVYVAGSPAVSLSNAWDSAYAKLLSTESGADADGVEQDQEFRAPGAGNCLLLLCPGHPDETDNIYFQFVKCVDWQDPNYLHDLAPAIIGEPITNHYGYHTANAFPHFPNRLSPYCTNFFIPGQTNTSFTLIPVNRDRSATPLDDMVLVFYAEGTNLWDVAAGTRVNSVIAWPHQAVRYDCQWPADAPTIVIASGMGSGPIQLEENWDIYVQNDTNQPGFNPNNEHALKYFAQEAIPQMRVNPQRLMVEEGASNQVEVWLTSEPPADVFVTLSAWPEGDTNLSSPLLETTNGLPLRIAATNWWSPQPIWFTAAPDTNGANGVRTFTVEAWGGLYATNFLFVHEADTNQPGLVLEALAFGILEGTNRPVAVRLTAPPVTNVTVRIEFVADRSDPSLGIAGTNELTFTPDDWQTNQTFWLEAAEDGDVADGLGIFRVEAYGGLGATNELAVTAWDNDPAPSAVYALRDDLGDPLGSTNSVTSEPYVLLTYTNAQGVGRMKVFRVVAEDPNYTLHYNRDDDRVEAGQLIRAPFPLSDPASPDELVVWEDSYGAAGPWWRDRKNNCWARAAGDDGGLTNIVMKYYYRFQSNSFYFPPEPGSRTRTNNEPVAWLDRRPGSMTNTPADVTYTIKWPDDVPKLRLGETLIQAKFGLPDIDGQLSVEVVYQQAEAQGVGTNVQLIDPTWTYTTTNLTELPGDVVTAFNPLDAKTYFPTLPPHLRSRLWYKSGTLNFKGEFRKKSGMQEPVGYLLLNVITGRDKAYLTGLSQDPDFQSAVSNLASQAASPRLVGPNDLFENLALTAGLATGTGYVTLAFNNAVRVPELTESVTLSVINVACPSYIGDVKVIESDDPFDEEATLRHTGDFAGQADHYKFQWQWSSDGPNGPWFDVTMDPESGEGALDLVARVTLVDGWYRCRYAPTNINHPCGTDWVAWTEPALVDGWTKRVADNISPFNQRYHDVVNQEVNTLVSMISQAGARWIGDVPFNLAALDDKGLIEIYESIFRRAINLSIEASPAEPADEAASRALLTIARRLADLYLVLGNEAYADASDPTIGYGTSDGQYGTVASSIYCFMDQVPWLIEEELGLLRGLDDHDGRNPRVYPAYNRLYWNFTRNITGGEVAYALNYNIRDESGSVANSVSADTARHQYPQGHGDAWGHYLMAIKNFYRLLRNANFVWSSEPEYVTVQGQSIPVNYADERKFAQAAAAKARTGAEIVSLTYRNKYVDDPAGQWQGYLDGDTNRAWGVSEWASRAGQGAIFDWVTGNALLPASSTNTGLAKVDRTTVTELQEVAVEFENIQQQLDKANTGLNPLGLAKNVLPFDIDPQGIVSGKTQFEQVYERAVTAMNNAIAVFNYAVNCSQLLRRQADEFTQFEQNVTDRRVDFTNRLIEVYGTPYADDIGPGRTYATGYQGPDIYNFMVSDYSEITGESPGTSVPFPVTYVEPQVGPDGSLTQVPRPVTYYLKADGLGVVKNPSWTGQRAAPGEIQTAYSDLLQSKARFERSLREYDNLIEEIESQAALLEAVHGLNAEEITVLYKDKGEQERLNKNIRRARSRQENWAAASRIATEVANAVAEALPRVVGIDNDYTAPARSAIRLVGAGVSELAMYKANQEGLKELDQQQAKEMAQAQQNIDLTTLRQEQAILSQVAQLAQLVRQEVLLRLEVYAQQEALQQMAGRYRAALARGQRLLADKVRFELQTAAHVQQARYKDMAFRIFRNEALQKYRAQFDLAAMYVYLAAKAYDYETNLRPGDPAGPGTNFIGQIVRARTIGLIESGLPQTGTEGDGGLADVMARMSGNFSVLKPQLGLNNPQETALVFSLRKEFLRIVPGTSSDQWRNALEGFRVEDLNEASEFRQLCLFENPRPEPGLVIPLPTTVNKDMNYFGWPYGPADNKFNETASSIKIYSVGVSFFNYRTTGSGGMANTPYVYFVPVGNDVLRCPRSSEQETNRFTRVWKVLDQWLPVPFDLGGPDGATTLAASGYIPSYAVGQGQDFLGRIRAFPAFRAWHDSLYGQSEGDPQFNTTLLISRSVWNTKWLLVIPASSLGSDYTESLDRFIYGGIINAATGQRDNNGVSDIRLRIKGYWYSGR